MEADRKINAALCCGILGCLCFGAGDWLMLFGDPAASGEISWLTQGAADIAAWRNCLAMGLAFPGIVLYAAALFALGKYIKVRRKRTVYHALTALGLTPWLCLHLFYIMILYLFSWMQGSGWQQAALPAAEALYQHLAWIVPLSEAVMLPPYIYWFYLTASGQSMLPEKLAAANPLLIYAVLRLASAALPESAFRMGFVNGLMSESMLVWFAVILLWNRQKHCAGKRNQNS